jgi:branched-chain amino acid transport system permease protein
MNVLIDGLVLGLNIALMALAFTAVFLPTGVFYIALGGIMALGPYVVRSLTIAGVPWPIAIVFTLMVGAGLSIACELFNHYPLERRRASMGPHLISSLGIYMIISEGIAMIWGSEVKYLRIGVGSSLRMGSIQVTHSQFLVAIVTITIGSLFLLWLWKSRLGLLCRGLADNPIEMGLRQHNVRFLRLMMFAVAGIIGTTASLSLAYDVGFQPHSGLIALLLAVVATIIGGRTSFVGPLIGGLLLGIVRSVVIWHLSAVWQDGVTLLILVLFLIIRPGGIIMHRMRLEAQT